MKPLLSCVAAFFLPLIPSALRGQLPEQPIQISRGEPQFVHDDYLVDSYWGLKSKNQTVKRVFHQPVKYDKNPFEIFSSDRPSYLTIAADEDENGAPLYRMYYQANLRLPTPNGKGPFYHTEICYAESSDGIEWTKPNLNLFPGKAEPGKPNNIVIGLPDRPTTEGNGPCLIETVRPDDRKDYRQILLFRLGGKGNGDIAGIHIAGTNDGIHFDMENSCHVAHLHSDTSNAICYNPVFDKYQMFCRAKNMYLRFRGDRIDTGASRRIATMFSSELRTDWLAQDTPQTLLTPDEVDAETNHLYFYGMPVVHRHGLFWGALQCFELNDHIHTELVTSRDGIHWQRLPNRPPLVPFGEEGTWDDNMIFASPHWVSAGNEWRFYYTGWDGPHGTPERDGSFGMAACLRERVFSRRGPTGGGVVCTREILWPGGDLWINAAALTDTEGEISVRISNAIRDPYKGFNYAECQIKKGKDPTRSLVKWRDRSLDE